MSTETSLEQKLREVKKAITYSEGRIVDLQEEIASLEHQIAEQAKPKLRHGMAVGREFSQWSPCITIGNGKDAKNYDRYGNIIRQTVPGVSSYGVICENVYALLNEQKALQENLDRAEFVETHTQSSTIKIAKASGGRLEITVLFQGRDLTGYINKDERDDFCMESRQIVATMKRKEAKK